LDVAESQHENSQRELLVSMTKRVWLVLLCLACYGFGAFSVTADELYALAISCGNTYAKCTYQFPLISHRFNLWDSWVMVFTGLGTSFFVGIIALLLLASIFEKSA